MGLGAAVARAYGIARSIGMYYGPVWRRGRMEAFYRQFLQPGDLAFDIGSHVGNRIRTFRQLGVRVVAVEPQPDFAGLIRFLYGRDPGVTIEECGLASVARRGSLYVSSRTPTLSTSAASWMKDVQADERFGPIRWDREIAIPLVTLDDLIARHGEPQFCKIDVEGSEAEVLAGLARPLAGVSFEYIPVAVDRAAACIARLDHLGDYRYRFSRAETMEWGCPEWIEGPDILALLRAMPLGDRSGDVYARRVSPP
jgi:FkbM family methyltransferase